MKIINALFARGLGGIEQAFVDYGRALASEGHTVLHLIHPDAKVLQELHRYSLSYKTVSNYGQWDVRARQRIRRHINDFQADIAIAHGNRALSLLTSGCKKRCPLIGVAHNYKTKRFTSLDGAITVTGALRTSLLAQGMDEEHVFHVPNMISLPHSVPTPHKMKYPPIIGSIGRFVEKKGFAVLVNALYALHKQGMDFHAILAGDGPERPAIQKQIDSLGLSDKITLPGWINDSAQFYNDITLFCLPSLHEPFGIVLLEAMVHGLPIVSTDSEGPMEILTHHYNALIVKKDDPTALAEGLSELMGNTDIAHALAVKGQETALEQYTLQGVAPKLSAALNRLRHLWQESL